MKRALALVIVIFLVTLVVRLPAAWVAGWLPSSVQCLSAEGTLWSGQCAELHAEGVVLQGVRWQLHPAALLRARLSADIQSEDARMPGNAHVEVGTGGEIDFQDVRATVPMEGAVSVFPKGWVGTLLADVQDGAVRDAHLQRLRGVLTLRDLRDTAPPTEFGSFALDFTGPQNADAMLGRLSDQGGPLAVTGTLLLKPSGAYELNGTVAPRDSATPDLQRTLQLLGPTDAQGRRSFSLAGSF